MAFPWTFADPVLGELTWDGDEDAWCGQVDLTPKHRVRLLFQADSKIVGLDGEAAEKQLASYVVAAHVVFQRLREMEWQIRLAIAGDVFELLGDWDGEGVALCMTLTRVTLVLGRAMDLEYAGRGPFAGKRFRGYFDELGGIEFADLE